MNGEIFLRRELPIDKVKLHKNISIPSEIHSYSLAIEYMKRWILEGFEENFGEDYFKTVYINGKHVLDDYRRFNKQELIKVEKPAVAITPTLNDSYNRDMIDLRSGGSKILARRSHILEDTIIRDYEHNYFLAMEMKQIEMAFNFRIRVSSRAQQIDIMNFMRYKFRVGETQSKYVSYDFHIPNEIIFNMANHSGYNIIKDDKGNYKVEDAVGFLSYLNAHSALPIIYKLRTINGNSEFFMRMPNQYTHIDNTDELTKDDGEREGQMDNNFHVEMNSILKIPTPSIYYYYSSDNINKVYSKREKFAGLYEISLLAPPDRNDKGWEQYLITEYSEETKHIDIIEFSELFTNQEIMSVIKHSISIGVSPSLFIDIVFYNDKKPQDIRINWETFELILNKDMKQEISVLAIYVDLGYVNEQLIVIQDLLKNRQK